MCDSLCIVGPTGTLFAKNSDRPPNEAQVVEGLDRRAAGDGLQTQYLTLPDAGAHAVIAVPARRGSGVPSTASTSTASRSATRRCGRPTMPRPRHPRSSAWTSSGSRSNGRGRADEAVDRMTELLETHGQGGSGEQDHDEPYFSSFLIADACGGWIVETSGRTWAAKPVGTGAAISNRISLGTDWTRASADVAAGRDFQDWRDPKAPTAIADLRLEATESVCPRGCCRRRTGSSARAISSPRCAITATGPWGAPGGPASGSSPVPTGVDEQWNGVTVCMHLRDYQATTASMVAELPADPDAHRARGSRSAVPARACTCRCSRPCGSRPSSVAPTTWLRFAGLRDRVEADPEALEAVRARLAGVEAELWERADDAAAPGTPEALDEFTATAWTPVDTALRALDA